MRTTSVIAFALCIAFSCAFPFGGISLPGGFSENTGLLNSEQVRGWVEQGLTEYNRLHNAVLNNIKVTSVKTQVVAGMNYQIQFEADLTDSIVGKHIKCNVDVFVSLSNIPQIKTPTCDGI